MTVPTADGLLGEGSNVFGGLTAFHIQFDGTRFITASQM